MKRRRIAVIGGGLEGRSLFSYLKKHNRDAELLILDSDKNLRLPRGAQGILGPGYLKHLSDFDFIYRSPGVPFNLPEIQKAKAKLSSLTRLFFESASRRSKGKIIGITGSAGKTTTATLIYRILKLAGKDAYLVGNIGNNPLAVLDKLRRDSITVMELSSFQLQDLKISPQVAVILDIYEEHQDKHGSFGEYIAAKKNICKFQKKSDFTIYCQDNKFSRKIAESSPAQKFPFSLKNSGATAFLKDGGIWHRQLGFIIPVGQIRLRGAHNHKNVMAALLAALASGVNLSAIRKAVRNFRGIGHRLEFVREFHKVKFYNDSKATNVGSALAGINSFLEKKVVLSGGYNKNLDLSPLAKRLSRGDISFAVLFGASRRKLAGLLKKERFSRFALAGRLEDAVGIAARKAKAGEVVILSPATASFDEFKNYEERGEKFKAAVFKIK